MRRVASALLVGFICAATAPATHGEPAPPSPVAFDSGRAWDHLRRQVAFGPRPAGSAALAECRAYIIGQLKAIGLDAREQAFEAETPVGRLRMVNVLATIPGARPDRIAIASHYDTKLFREFRFVGANDGGSSTAVLLELARVLKARRNLFSIELLFLDGEEATLREWAGTDNTYGSRYYVADARKTGTLRTLKSLVLLDMVGDEHLNFRRESSSTPWLTEIIWAAAAKLGHDEAFLRESMEVSDDHAPFLQAGIPSVDIIDLDYAAWHTPADTLDSVKARSLQITGSVVLEALPQIEKRLAAK